MALLRPPGTTFFGVGASLHAAAVSSLGYLTGPQYLTVISANAELDKFDAKRATQEVAWSITSLHNLECVSAATLKAGMMPSTIA